MNVMKLFNVRRACKTSGELGVEVECEGSNLPFESHRWNGEYDGSLLDGESREYVLKKPLSLLGVYQAIKELDNLFTDCKVKLKDSVRAGVHVHVNMQDSSKAQLFNLITLWAVFEDVLLDRCGAYRKGNLFCYPLSRSDNVFNIMMKAAEDSGQLRYFSSDQYRYCAVNVVSLSKYGSLEFRAMRTPRNVTDVYQWAKLLLRMKTFSAEFANPREMIDCINDIGVDAFYADVFEGFEDYLTHKTDLAKQVNEGLMVASAIAYSSDWEEEAEHTEPFSHHVLDEVLKDEVARPEIIEEWKPRKKVKARPLFGDVVPIEGQAFDLEALGAFVEEHNRLVAVGALEPIPQGEEVEVPVRVKDGEDDVLGWEADV